MARARRRGAPARPLDAEHVAITGGARGIGAATARLLRSRGARVTIGDIDEQTLAATAELIGCEAVPCDVTSRESFEYFVEEAERRQGPVTTLVNNAGIMPIGPFVEEPDEVARRQVEINVLGVILGTKIVLPRFMQRRAGHVINIAPVAGRFGWIPGEATYVATKHAVVGLDEALRCELEGTGVDCSTVLPNLADTDLGAGMSPARGSEKLSPEEVAERIVEVVQRPEAEAYVPSSLKPQVKIGMAMPRAVQRLAYRLLNSKEVATNFNERERREYEERVAPEAHEETAKA